MAAVLAGPYNSRAYIVGRHVLIKAQGQCPTFTYRLIPMELKKWRSWLAKTCREKEWSFDEVKKYKVLSWLEQGYTGVPTMLLGDLSPLLEYLYDRYGVFRTLTASEMNELIKETEEQWRKEGEEDRGLVITIVGAGSNEAVNFLLYALMTMKTPALKDGIKVKLFEAREDNENQLMENYKKMSLVETGINIILIEELADIFENCELIIFLGDKFRKPGMDVEEFFHLEKVLYSTYGFLCNFYMEKQTKVLFGCMENACFNAQCFLAEAPDIDHKRVVAITSYLGTELKTYISKIGRFAAERIEDIPVWGMADTAHLVDVDMGCFIYKVPDGNSDTIEPKSSDGLAREERMKLELYQKWELMDKARVANWRFAKLKEKLEEEEYMSKILEEGINTVEIRNERIYMLNLVIEQMEETKKTGRKLPYWEPWETLMAPLREKDLYYSYENMVQRFKKSFYNVLQHYKYIEKEAMKKKMKNEKLDYEKLFKHPETLRDFSDPFNTGTIDLYAVQKILAEDLRKGGDQLEEMREELLFEETELIEEVNEINNLRRELYEKCKILYEIVRLYLKSQMEEEMRRLKRNLRQNEDEMGEEGSLEKQDLKRERSLDDKDREATKWIDAWDGEHEQEPEPAREELSEMVEQYFKYKIEVEQKIKEFQGGEWPEDSTYDVYALNSTDDYDIRNLGTVTRNMRHLWEFVGVCKYAVRKKIGQDPYIAQVTELIKVMKIWFLDPYMKNETMFLGIVSDSEEYPFPAGTIISQPAFCDDNMRWHPQKELGFLWPPTIQKKMFDDPEAPVPVRRQLKEGDPFTVTYAMVTALKCLMHFEVPVATILKILGETQKQEMHSDKTQTMERLLEMEEMEYYFASSEQEEEQEKEEKDISTGCYKNIESDFCPRGLTDMPSFETNINSSFRLEVCKKGIHDGHNVQVGFPLDTKGRSELDLKEELDKLDFGKMIYDNRQIAGSQRERILYVGEYIDDADAKEPVQESGEFLRLSVKESYRVRSTVQRQEESTIEEKESLVIKVPPPDDRQDDDDEELFEPYCNPPKSDTISSKTTLSEETERDSEEIARKPKKQSREKLLKRISKFLKDPSHKTSATPDWLMDRSQKIVVMKRKDINFECDWLRNLVTKFGIPEKGSNIKKSCFYLVSKHMRYLEKASRTDLCIEEREWYEEGLEEEMSREIEKEESVKTQMSKDFGVLAGFFGRVTRLGIEKQEHFGSWMIKIIDEFKSYKTYSHDPNLPMLFEQGKEPLVKKLRIPEESFNNHRSWIIKMIKTIISIDNMRIVKKLTQKSDSSKNTWTEGSREMDDMEKEQEWQEAEMFSSEEQARNEDAGSDDYDNDDVD